MHLAGDRAAFKDTLVRGLALGFFVTIPAALGYLALAQPLARAISFGRLDSATGVTLVASRSLRSRLPLSARPPS